MIKELVQAVQDLAKYGRFSDETQKWFDEVKDDVSRIDDRIEDFLKDLFNIDDDEDDNKESENKDKDEDEDEENKQAAKSQSVVKKSGVRRPNK